MSEEKFVNEEVEEVEIKRDMSFFMADKAEEVEERKFIISERYKDNKGKPIPFIMKPISTSRIEELEKACQKPHYIKGKHVGNKLDSSRWLARVGIESTVYPDFYDEGLRKSYKTEDPIEIVKKMLSVGGEYSAWLEAVSTVNKLHDDFEELVDEAKN